MDLTPIQAARRKEDEADACIKTRQWNEALQCLSKSLFFNPNSITAHAKKAQVYWEMTDTKAAMASLRQALAIDIDTENISLGNLITKLRNDLAGILDIEGYNALLQGRPRLALTFLTEATELNRLEEAYWLHRAIALIQLGQYEIALADITHCIRLNAHDVEYYVLRAKLHWKVYLHDEAAKDIRHAAKLQPDHPEVLDYEQRLLKKSRNLHDQAKECMLVRDFGPAISKLTDALEIVANDPKLYLLRASAHRESHNFHAALQDVEMALKCHKKRKQTQESMDTGMVALYSKLPREEVDIILQRNLILNDLALYFLQEQSYQLALDTMNQAIQGEKQLMNDSKSQRMNPQLFVSRGDAYRGLEHFQAALSDYHSALKELPHSQEVKSRIALVHYNFGINLFNKGQFEPAVIEFSRALENDDHISAFYERRGDAYRYLEHHEAAYADYQQARALAPDNIAIRIKSQQYDSSSPTLPKRNSLPQINPTKNNQGNIERKVKRDTHRSSMPAPLQKAHVQYRKKDKAVQDLYHKRLTSTETATKFKSNQKKHK